MQWFDSPTIWNSVQNQRNFLEEIARKYEINSPHEWAKVSSNIIKERGGNAILLRHQGSLFKALQTIFPGYNSTIKKVNNRNAMENGMV